MADEIDLANDLIDVEVSRALSKLRKNAVGNAMGAKNCIECGDGIPHERQKLGFRKCKACAEESERRKALFNDYRTEY